MLLMSRWFSLEEQLLVRLSFGILMKKTQRQVKKRLLERKSWKEVKEKKG